MNLEFNEVKKEIELLMREVGEVLREGFLDKEKSIEFKNDRNTDWLTKYDLKSEDMIVKYLDARWPDFNILTEEVKSCNKKSDYTWIIDPIDGTINFTRGIRDFAIGISLAEKEDVVMSFVYLPMYDEFYYASLGKGAFCNDRRIYVSENKLNNCDVDISIYRDRNLAANVFKNLIEDVRYTKCYYSSIYSLVLIASGKLDVLIGQGGKVWDYSPYLIVQEAGGGVTDMNGKEFNINSKSIVVTNGVVHDKILEKIKK